MIGQVHSTYMGGMVDGPGIRYVLFMAGCPLRCQYCHNPDTWGLRLGTPMTVDALMQDVEQYRSYMRFSGGGVTVTGGEPLIQAEFLAAFLRACRENDVHTAVQTSGYMLMRDLKKNRAAAVLEHADLILLDIKAFDETLHKNVTGVSNRRIHDFLRLCEEMQKPTWIRYVLVPGLTDNPADLESLAGYLRGFSCIERVEVLPFHKAGEFKWAGMEYKLADTPPPTVEEVARVQGLFG